MRKYIISILFLFVFISFVQAQTVTYQFSNNLSVGNSGSDVSQLQAILEQKGFLAMPAGAKKGYFGEMTKQALIRYQQNAGLPATGFFGPLTRTHISQNVIPSIPPTLDCFPNMAPYYKVGFGWQCGNNRSPVINGIDAPSLLSINQIGTWTIRASDPENGTLSYSVDWGDSRISYCNYVNCSATTINTAAKSNSFVQGVTFTHSYSTPGIYTVKFTAINNNTNQAQSSATVKVNAVEDPYISDITILTPKGGEVWTINSNEMITWRLNNLFSNSTSIKVDIYLDGRQLFNPPSCSNCTLPSMPSYLGGTTYVLDKNISNTGQYYWIVGTDIINKPIPAGIYGIRICIAGTNDCRGNDTSFTLVDPGITPNNPQENCTNGALYDTRTGQKCPVGI